MRRAINHRLDVLSLFATSKVAYQALAGSGPFISKGKFIDKFSEGLNFPHIMRNYRTLQQGNLPRETLYHRYIRVSELELITLLDSYLFQTPSIT